MKVLDKIGLVIFSIVVLVMALVICIIISGFLDLNMALDGVESLLTNATSAKIVYVTSIVLILLAIKCLLFNSDTKEKSGGKEGILLANENGKLLVSKDTIESLTNTVVKTFETAQTVMTKVDVDTENNISVFITLFVYPDAIIKDLIIKLQSDVKNAIKKSLDLDVKEVNVRVKNINAKKEPIIKE